MWLAAFTEEHYRGFRLSKETQLHSPAALREADAARKRAVRALGEGAQLQPLDATLQLAAVTPSEADLVEMLDRQRRRRMPVVRPAGVTWEAMLASVRSRTW